jgi:hypothetical protein
MGGGQDWVCPVDPREGVGMSDSAADSKEGTGLVFPAIAPQPK